MGPVVPEGTNAVAPIQCRDDYDASRAKHALDLRQEVHRIRQVLKYCERHDKSYGVIIFWNRIGIEIALVNLNPSIRPPNAFGRATQMLIPAPEIEDP